jgi:DNA-binding transcriptional LysR family regulator
LHFRHIDDGAFSTEDFALPSRQIVNNCERHQMGDFKNLETFVWVVTLRSFHGAANKLRTTQPAISQRIAMLERELGVQLLQRDRHNVFPTPEGREVLLYAEKLIKLRSQMIAAVGDPSIMGGILRLGVSETIVHTLLSRLIKSVDSLYPNLSIEVEVDISRNLRRRLFAQEIDLALLLGPLEEPGLENLIVCEYPNGFVASPALKVGKAPSLHDLARHSIITFGRGTQPFEVVKSLFNRPGCQNTKIHASASLATVVYMALEGIGIAVVPTAIVEKEIASRKLLLLNTDVRVPSLKFSATWLSHPSTTAAKLVAELAVKVAEQPILDAAE